ncbi:MAG TPA: hypothetical protein VHO06_12585 [Polyangia bacterium]|nr:hypothetical protein [Polyangia bacterium]
MVIASVDSATTAGLAVVSRDPLRAVERLLFVDTIQIAGASDVTEAVAELALFGPDLFVVEQPFLGRNPTTFLSLAETYGRWRQAIETAGYAMIGVPASMWQPRVLPGFTPRMRSAERKTAAIGLIRELFDRDLEENAADAACLGLYAARNTRIGDRSVA